MNIHLLGTASAESGINRDNTSLLLNHGGTCTFIDVSGNPLGKLKKLDIQIGQVKRVIITHFHLDHYYGLPSLLWGMSQDERKEPLHIYCAKEHVDKLQALLDAIEVCEWENPVLINIKDFNWEKENTIISEENLTIATFPAIHGTPNVGVAITYHNKKIVYSSDTSPNPVIRDLSKIDLLIHEATTATTILKYHTSLKEILDYYPINKIDHIVLVHLSDFEPYEEILKKSMIDKSKVSIGYDGMVINLTD